MELTIEQINEALEPQGCKAIDNKTTVKFMNSCEKYESIDKPITLDKLCQYVWEQAFSEGAEDCKEFILGNLENYDV